MVYIDNHHEEIFPCLYNPNAKLAVPENINDRIHQTVQQSKHDGTFLCQNYNLSVEQFKHNSTNFRTFQRIDFKTGKASGFVWQSCCLVKTLLKAAIEYKHYTQGTIYLRRFDKISMLICWLIRTPRN